MNGEPEHGASAAPVFPLPGRATARRRHADAMQHGHLYLAEELANAVFG
jgi:hypothetical protein